MAVVAEKSGRIVFDAGDMRFEFSSETGKWLALSFKGEKLLEGDNRLSDVTLTVDGVMSVNRRREVLWNIRDAVPIGAHFRLSSYDLSGRTLNLHLQGDGWQVVEHYAYNEGKNRVERSMDLLWQGDGETLLRWAEMRMPPVANPEDCTLEMPGYSDFLHEKCANMPMGRMPNVPDGIDRDASTWRPGVLCAVQPQGNLVSWLYGEDMLAFWQLYRGVHGVWMEQKWYCCDRMQRGDSLHVGTQYIQCGNGDFMQEIMVLQDFWDEVDIRLKQPTPDWAKQPFIYEAHVGPKSFPYSGRVYEAYKTMQDLIDDLPRIKKLGFTILQLMPRFAFPGYSVSDYFNLSAHYGEEKELRKLIETLHKMDMKIFLDVIVHGVTDKQLRPNAVYDRHPLLDEHPEFFSYDEEGNLNSTGTWAFDHANEGLQEYIKDAFVLYVKELDVDGFRVDCLSWNYYPSWKKDLPYPVYRSIHASFYMSQKIRDAVMAIKPDVAFYTETPGPLMTKAYDLSYIYDEIWFYETLMPPIIADLPMRYSLNRLYDGTKVDGRGAAEWLDLRQRVMPRHFIKVRHTDSHDSHEWRSIGFFRREYQGLQQSRAHFAYCCFVDGGVMNFVGGEQGSEEIYAELIEKRKQNPALLKGSIDYIAVVPENTHLFTPLREKDGQRMMPVINFSLETVKCGLNLSALKLKENVQYKFKEHFSGLELRGSGKEMRKLPVEVDGYHYQLWEILQT